MHHTNAEAPPASSPLRVAPSCRADPADRLASNRSAPDATRVGRPMGDLHSSPPPHDARTRTAARMPPSALTGYEQILAARAAMRAQVERTAAAERRAFASALSPPPVPGRRSAEQPRRGARLRRLELVASALAAAPACALLALAWVGASHHPVAHPAGSAPLAQLAPPPPAEEGLVSAARNQAAPPWAADAEAPQKSASAGSAVNKAKAEPAPPVAEKDEPVVAAADRSAPSWAAAFEPAKPRESGSHPPVPSHAEEEPVPPATADAGTERNASAAEGAAWTTSDGELPALSLSAHAAEPLAEGEAGPAPTSADSTGLASPPLADQASTLFSDDARQVRSAAPAEAATVAPDAVPAESGKLAVPPAQQRQMAAVAAVPLPAGRTPAKARPGGSTPRGAVRATGDDAPLAGARCRGIVMKAQLGEETSHTDRSYLRTACASRR